MVASRPSERRTYLEGGKGVTGDIERVHFYIVKELVDLLRVEDNLGEDLVTQALSQDHAAVQSNLLVLISIEFTKRSVRMGLLLVNIVGMMRSKGRGKLLSAEGLSSVKGRLIRYGPMVC